MLYAFRQTLKTAFTLRDNLLANLGIETIDQSVGPLSSELGILPVNLNSNQPSLFFLSNGKNFRTEAPVGVPHGGLLGADCSDGTRFSSGINMRLMRATIETSRMIQFFRSGF